MPYRCLFFDLDHTLWDYETNSAETLQELYHRHQLEEKGALAFAHFLQSFVEVNTRLWDLYDRGLIHRDVIRFNRFDEVFQKSNVHDLELSLQFSTDYITESPKKAALLPFAKETLQYLHTRYSLFIITNGFDEIQSTKLASSGIRHFFKDVITSARAGHKKPAKEIFEFALRQHGFEAHETLMIGDNLATDILGARNASIDTVFFNPANTVHQEIVNYEITRLDQLCSLL